MSVSVRGASLAACQADVCEACGMLRLTSFRTGQPCYELADEVSLDDAVPRPGRFLTTVRGSGRRAG